MLNFRTLSRASFQQATSFKSILRVVGRTDGGLLRRDTEGLDASLNRLKLVGGV